MIIKTILDSLWRGYLILNEKVDQKGVAPRTPYFARGRRNVTMVYNKTRFQCPNQVFYDELVDFRSGVKQGLLRPKLSQRPGGVFKKNNLHEKGKNVKVRDTVCV